MKFVAFIFLLITPFYVWASPSEVGCQGRLNGDTVLLRMGFAHLGEGSPSLISIEYKGNTVFKSDRVKEIILNVGTDDNPFHNTAWVGDRSKDVVVVRIPEQDPELRTYNVYLSISTMKDIKLENRNELEMVCDK